jgi:antitoxin VapB
MGARHVRIFKNGRNQAIRIPRELELSTSEATIHREGNEIAVAAQLQAGSDDDR